MSQPGGLLWSPSLVLLCACGNATPWISDSSNANTPRPIINGEPATSAFDQAVVALTYNGDAFCTGTLIAPAYVLSAAHCMDWSTADLPAMAVFFGQDHDLTGKSVAIKRLVPHPNYDDLYLENDIALVEMAAAAPPEAVPIPFLPAAQGLQRSDEGRSIRLVGFGTTETGSFGVKLQTTTSIGRVCEGPSECFYLEGPVVPKAFGYTDNPGTTCFGDSGGPAFLQRGTTTYVIGVTSYGINDNCLGMGVSTTVDRFESFILGTMAGGGGSGGATDVGATCLVDSDCGAGGTCVDEATYPEFDGGYCLAPCSFTCPGDGVCAVESASASSGVCWDGCVSNADCRAGYTCQQFDGASVCYPVDSGVGGTSALGDACVQDSDCVQPSRCLEEDQGAPDGLCYAFCEEDLDCGDGALCYSSSLCLIGCERNSDCRAGYACWPDPDDSERGGCFMACVDDADCEGEPCNENGLCGNRLPPAEARGDGPSLADGLPTSRLPKGSASGSGCSASSGASAPWLLLGFLCWRRALPRRARRSRMRTARSLR